jgi:hypothetical protein
LLALTRTNPASREIESARAPNLVDSEEVVEGRLDHALHVGVVRSQLVHVGDGEHRQGLRGIVPPDRGLQRVLGIEIAIVGDEDELLGLTVVPDLEVGRGSREPEVLKVIERKAEGLPEFGSGVCLHASDQEFHLPLDVGGELEPSAPIDQSDLFLHRVLLRARIDHNHIVSNSWR